MNINRILIVDDHEDFRKTVEGFLKKFPTVEVVGEASDGEEAIQKVESLMPDIVLMDIAMPHCSGLEATRLIKQKWPNVKVIITTTFEYPIYKFQATEVKADDYILKRSLKADLEKRFRVIGSTRAGKE
ncbi:MAG: response regulator transcription factor [bacterium]